MSILHRQAFEPSCPTGGKWYACNNGAMFVGCCVSDPCNSNGCPAGNLRAASFNPKFYGQFADQSCPSGSLWYTCTGTTIPFMGCCKSVACANSPGCPLADLTAGFLSSNPVLAAQFLPSSAIAQATVTSTSVSSVSMTSSAASTASASPATVTIGRSTSPSSTPSVLVAQPAAPTVTAQSSPVGAIAGGVVGGIAVIAMIVGLALFFRYRSQKQNVHYATVPHEKLTTFLDPAMPATHSPSKSKGRYQDNSARGTPVLPAYQPPNTNKHEPSSEIFLSPNLSRGSETAGNSPHSFQGYHELPSPDPSSYSRSQTSHAELPDHPRWS